jgi:phosphatidylserine decarboxylase
MKFDQGKLLIWNGEARKFEEEKVFGRAFVELLYGNALGRVVAPLLTHNTLLSKAYGWWQSQKFSARKIDRFVKSFEIRLEDYEGYPYTSFNDFFIRPFKSGKRPFVQGSAMPAFCEARYSFFEKSTREQRLGIKGSFLNPAEILGDSQLASKFMGGPLAVARLCPVDYHRYHFPDSGRILESKRIPGKLDSVNPMSLLKLPGVFSENERHLVIIETDNFGTLAFVDVGAICVGKIVQHHAVGNSFKRGEERGYFLFGGSTVIVFGEAGRFSWRPDLVEKCKEDWEVWMPLGSQIASNC